MRVCMYVCMDPSLWGLGDAPLTAFAVRDACLRLLRLRAAAELPCSYAPCCAVAPRLCLLADVLQVKENMRGEGRE